MLVSHLRNIAYEVQISSPAVDPLSGQDDILLDFRERRKRVRSTLHRQTIGTPIYLISFSFFSNDIAIPLELCIRGKSIIRESRAGDFAVLLLYFQGQMDIFCLFKRTVHVSFQ